MPGEKLSQIILDFYLKLENLSMSGKILERLLKLSRSILLRYSDPLVRYKYAGREIVIPLSHDLPLSKKNYPQYGDNLQRLAGYLKEKFNDLTMIDVGANVGDTAILVNQKYEIPVLCIEGDEKYFQLMEQNTGDIKSIVKEKAFIGDNSSINAKFITQHGTGRVVEENSPGNIKFISLREIIIKYPLFAKSKLLKIDTDGFDSRIIKSELSLLSQMKPAIFFEYDPFHMAKLNDDGLSVFSELVNIGYEHFLFFDNSGDFLLKVNSGQFNIISDIHNYYSGRKGERYADICAIHREDGETASFIRNNEIEFFKSFRK